jgi:hypothetical protein
MTPALKISTALDSVLLVLQISHHAVYSPLSEQPLLMQRTKLSTHQLDGFVSCGPLKN